MTTTKKKQGAIYGRKSRENEATLENQINSCIQWAEENDIEYEILLKKERNQAKIGTAQNYKKC